MADNKVFIVARLQAKPGQAAEVRSILQALVAPTLKEQGCLRYELLQRQDDPTAFVFVETWASDASLEAHMATPHFQGALPRLLPLLTAPPDIARFQPVG